MSTNCGCDNFCPLQRGANASTISEDEMTGDAGLSRGGPSPEGDNISRSQTPFSYNSWRYGDGASQNSIPEGPREAAVGGGEVIKSSAETESEADTDQEPGPQLQRDHSEIEVCWANRGDTDPQDETEEDFRFYSSHNSRRVRIIAATCLLLMIVTAVALAVIYSQGTPHGQEVAALQTTEGEPLEQPPQEQQPQEQQPSGQLLETPEVDTEGDPASTEDLGEGETTEELAEETPTTKQDSDKPVVTQRLSPEIAHLLTKEFVYEALSGCVNGDILRSSSTRQGQMVDLLADALYDASKFYDDGTFFIPVDMGHGWIQDRFAMMTLFEATHGQSWIDHSNWLQQGVCDAGNEWYGVSCQAYREDNCGVLGLDLNANALSGHLPDELCCMQCLTTLSVAGNPSLSSSVPQCMASVQVDIDEGDPN